MKLGSNEIKRIREVFTSNYKDLGIYRWLNRNKKVLKASFLISFVAVLSIALMGQSWPITFWSFAFIGTIFLGGLDHFIIGLRFRRMLNILESEGISITLSRLLELCSDISPN
jgi:hypothetical protein